MSTMAKIMAPGLSVRFPFQAKNILMVSVRHRATNVNISVKRLIPG